MNDKTHLTLAAVKDQAKTLLKRLKAGDPEAVSRAVARKVDPQTARLADCHHLVALEHSFKSWPDLKRGLERSAALAHAPADLARLLLEDGWKETHALLKQLPELVEQHSVLALAMTDSSALKSHLARGLAVNEKLPNLHLHPLLLVCQSRVPGRGATECARLLIEAGADIEVKWFHHGWPESPLGALYAASGIRRDPELTELLLKAGINPNDNESVYHATESADTTCLRLLLQHGASVKKTNALNHQLDTERMEGLELLLQAGADPDEPGLAPALHWAIKNGRSGRIIARLIEAGADVNREWHGAAARSLAVLAGNEEAASLIGEKGGVISPAAEAVLALRAGKAPVKIDPSAISKAELECLSFAAANGQAERVKELVKLGWPLHSMAYHDGSPLHWACWHGNFEAALALIEAGSDLTLLDPRFKADPLGWTCHGSVNAHPRKPEYPKIAEALLAAGAQPFEVTSKSFGRPDVIRVVKAAWRKAQSTS